jgi:hypothetical protein
MPEPVKHLDWPMPFRLQRGRPRPWPLHSRRIVQAHRGRIRLEKTPGGGATFVVELPRAPEARQDRA